NDVVLNCGRIDSEMSPYLTHGRGKTVFLCVFAYEIENGLLSFRKHELLIPYSRSVCQRGIKAGAGDGRPITCSRHKGRAMESNRGVALILALLVLSFLTLLGSALVSTATIDIWISDNYKAATQNLYVAEAGIDQAREVLRVSEQATTQLLTTAAGPDGQLVTSTDLTTLLASDDQPL